MSSRPRPPLLPASSSSPPASRADDPRLPISAAPLSAALDMSRPASRADALISEIAAALLSDASDMPVPALCATACTVSNSLWASCNCALKRFTFNIKLTTSSPAFILKSFFMVYMLHIKRHPDAVSLNASRVSRSSSSAERCERSTGRGDMEPSELV